MCGYLVNVEGFITYAPIHFPPHAGISKFILATLAYGLRFMRYSWEDRILCGLSKIGTNRIWGVLIPIVMVG
jgi:hypothetical protein